MEPETGRSREWEEVVELARLIDHGVASRKGVEGDDVLRLARAVLAFHGRIATGPAVTPKLDPTSGSGKGGDLRGQ
jgi:hypothetical protein